MEEQGSEFPLKVCRHCSVASRTEAETCPNCGKPYVRGGAPRLRWSWWFAIPIVAAAFAIGYFGISQLIGGDSSDEGVITAEQAGAVTTGATRAELDEALDGEQPAYTDRAQGKPETTCLYYGLEDEPDGLWSFCFADDELLTSAPVGAGVPQAPAP